MAQYPRISQSKKKNSQRPVNPKATDKTNIINKISSSTLSIRSPMRPKETTFRSNRRRHERHGDIETRASSS